MLTGRWFVEHDQRFCVTRAPVFVDGPVSTLTFLLWKSIFQLLTAFLWFAPCLRLARHS